MACEADIDTIRGIEDDQDGEYKRTRRDGHGMPETNRARVTRRDLYDVYGMAWSPRRGASMGMHVVKARHPQISAERKDDAGQHLASPWSHNIPLVCVVNKYVGDVS